MTFRVWRDGQAFDLAITPKDSGAGPKIGIAPKTVLKKFGPAGRGRRGAALDAGT